MKKASIIRAAIVAAAFLLLSSASVMAQQVDCATRTGEDIVKEIYTKLAVKYDAQLIHVNARIKDGVVTLEGWATTKKVRKDMEKIIKKIKCVKSIDNQLTIGLGGGCGPGEKKCGTICIPQTETCNICNAKTCT